MADTIDPASIGPARPSNGASGGFSVSRVLKDVSIRAGTDAKSAAERATMNAIKKLGSQKTPGSAQLPDVAPAAPLSLSGKFKALPSWARWAIIGVGAFAVIKIVSPGGD